MHTDLCRVLIILYWYH